MINRTKNNKTKVAALVVLSVLLIIAVSYAGFSGDTTTLQGNKNTYPNSSEYIEQYRRISLRPQAFATVSEDLVTNQTLLPPEELGIGEDRSKWLKGLVLFITDRYETKKDKAIAWVIFLQNQIYHSNHCPILNNEQAIYDPKWIIENRIAHCGQTNRAIVDGLKLIDIQSRVVQLKGHVAAEAYWNGDWHYLDADAIGFSQIVTDVNGSIPSVLEIMREPELVSEVKYHTEIKARSCLSKETFKPARQVFERIECSGRLTPYTYIKTATPDQEKNEYYGWNHYDTIAIEE